MQEKIKKQLLLGQLPQRIDEIKKKVEEARGKADNVIASISKRVENARTNFRKDDLDQLCKDLAPLIQQLANPFLPLLNELRGDYSAW